MSFSWHSGSTRIESRIQQRGGKVNSSSILTIRRRTASESDSVIACLRGYGFTEWERSDILIIFRSPRQATDKLHYWTLWLAPPVLPLSLPALLSSEFSFLRKKFLASVYKFRPHASKFLPKLYSNSTYFKFGAKSKILKTARSYFAEFSS